MMKPEEALKNIGDWISEETRKQKYDKITVIELSDSLITLKNLIEKQIKSEKHLNDELHEAVILLLFEDILNSDTANKLHEKIDRR